MWARSSMVGRVTSTCLSNRPGLSKALSRMSALLVAANTMTEVSVENPSISTSSWLRVLSLSSLPPPILPCLFLPTASISSMKMIAGALDLAFLKRSLTLEAPTPTNISTKSEPEMVKKGTFDSPATALASRVLPVPGGPTRSAPLGTRAPSFWYFLGSLRKSTNSMISFLAPSLPATCLNLVLIFWPSSPPNCLALDLLIPNMSFMPPPPPNRPPDFLSFSAGLPIFLPVLMPLPPLPL
mmetsp:Transcript_18256/g.31236  ORF Transcript_18256/g.31236 Transcript_18256/m.31236 type:complete len:240 (-) Transcript_18256:877-1596(-)